MNDCCDSPVAERGARACEVCAADGSRSSTSSADALPLLRQSGQRDFGHAGDRCGTGDIRLPVWQKEPSGARVLCYCFGETESGIRRELVEHGRTEVVTRIRITAQGCACDIRNPRGACCLGDVMAAVKRMEGTLESVKED